MCTLSVVSGDTMTKLSERSVRYTWGSASTLLMKKNAVTTRLSLFSKVKTQERTTSAGVQVRTCIGTVTTKTVIQVLVCCDESNNFVYKYHPYLCAHPKREENDRVESRAHVQRVRRGCKRSGHVPARRRFFLSCEEGISHARTHKGCCRRGRAPPPPVFPCWW